MGTSLIINLGFTISPWGRKGGILMDAGRGSEIDASRGAPLRSVGEGGGVGEGVEVFEGAGGFVRTGERDGEREFGVGGRSLSVGESRGGLAESAVAATCMSWRREVGGRGGKEGWEEGRGREGGGKGRLKRGRGGGKVGKRERGRGEGEGKRRREG